MKIGLIGLGRIGQLHAQTLTELEVVDELIVTDPLPGVAEAVAAERGAGVATSAAELLGSGIDAVVIASSTPTHLELIEAAVRAGIPTFCESRSPRIRRRQDPWRR